MSEGQRIAGSDGPGGGLRMTFSGPRRRLAERAEPGAQAIYGLGMVFQVSPTEIAVELNRRPCAMPVVDLEDGADLFIVDALDRIGSADAVPFLRNEPGRHPSTGAALVMVKYPAAGGFVPRGALLPDGRPHPHAGTGFALGIVLGYPADHSIRRPEGAGDVIQRFELVQFGYDGARIDVTARDPLEGGDLFAGWTVHRQALGNAIPSGEDLIFSHVAMRPGEKRVAGVSRWRRSGGRWWPSEFVPVTPPENPYEPSMVRDLDGSLLLCVRTGLPQTKGHFQVYRSADEGRSWALSVDDPDMRCPSPVSILTTVDGRPMLAGNPFRRDYADNEGRMGHSAWMREEVDLWLLTDDRRHVRIPCRAFDARARLGPVRQDPARHINFWYVDHPVGGVFRLGDGRWRCLLGFRVCDLWDVVTGAPPAAASGFWMEEIAGGGPARPAWRFGENT